MFLFRFRSVKHIHPTARPRMPFSGIGFDFDRPHGGSALCWGYQLTLKRQYCSSFVIEMNVGNVERRCYLLFGRLESFFSHDAAVVLSRRQSCNSEILSSKK